MEYHKCITGNVRAMWLREYFGLPSYILDRQVVCSSFSSFPHWEGTEQATVGKFLFLHKVNTQPNLKTRTFRCGMYTGDFTKAFFLLAVVE